MPTSVMLRSRRRRPELMDQPGLDAAEHRYALDALRRINWVSRTAQSLWSHIRPICERHRGHRAVRLLDVATGGGDLPIELWKRARREGLNLEVAGCDRSAQAVGYARANAERERAEVEFFEHDAIAQPLPQNYDILTSSLFLHHLGEVEAVGFLRALRSSGGLVLVDDLKRGVAGWLLAYLGTRILSRSRVAQVDGPISVEGAFSPVEARSMAMEAGWESFELHSRWPCRFLLIGRFG